ncbi:unnamed protein product [marine sediment metagenome]|uniref:Uncharacterized protein n=1 Tax=marine sediment metagenome TaxID=412755 RepID=X1EPZ6_9ZZZZ
MTLIRKKWVSWEELEEIQAGTWNPGTHYHDDIYYREGASPTFEDITINTPSSIYDLSHDAFADFEAGEHFTMLNEDDMATDSDTQAATQQSIKAYVDAGGGGGTFLELSDSPASYSGQAGKFVKVKATEDGLEFAAVNGGNGGGLGRLDVDEDFEGLDIGTIDGQGSYTGWTPWVVWGNENTSAEIVDIGGDYDKILRLARTEGAGQVKCGLDFNDSDNNWGLRSGFYIRFKVRANPDNLENLWVCLRTIEGNVFRFGVRFDPTQTYKFYYAGGAASTLWNTVDDTWYDVGLILFPGYVNPYLQIFKDSPGLRDCQSWIILSN